MLPINLSQRIGLRHVSTIRKKPLIEQYLNVDGWVAEIDQWDKFGVTPYLNADDGDANSVGTAETGKWMQYFTFEDTILSSLSVATLYLVTRCTSDIAYFRFTPYIWDGAYHAILSFNILETYYRTVSMNVISILDTIAKINNARMSLQSFGDFPQRGYITHAYLHVKV